MTGYVATVRPRWSDMDVFGHVNHANVVTLLEEARIPLLFGGAAERGMPGLAQGVVVVRLAVDYRAPVVVRGSDVRISISLCELKFASFTLGYSVHEGPSEEDNVAVTAETVLAPYDVATGRPRRLDDAERDFLRLRLDDTGSDTGKGDVDA